MTKYKKHFKIGIPSVLVQSVEEILKTNPPSFKYEISGFYGIIRDITTSMGNCKDAMVPLCSKILQPKYGANYRLMLDYLVQNKIINENHQYLDGKCRKFGVTVKSGQLKNLTVIDIGLDTKYGKYVKKRHNKEQVKAKSKDSYIRELRNEFYNLKFDSTSALIDLNLRKDSLTYEQFIAISDDIICLHHQNQNRRYFNRNTTNQRIDNNITSLKSFYKKYIISTTSLFQLDLNNSQPVLFNVVLDLIIKLINEEINIKDITLTLCYGNKRLKQLITQCYQGIKDNAKLVGFLQNEILKYKHFTSNGIWYNHLADLYNDFYLTEYFDRQAAKSLWMALAYSGDNSQNYKKSKEAFKQNYPGISKIFQIFKKTNYKDLSIILQNIESKIFIDDISKALIHAGIVPLTVHDAIIVNENQLIQSREIMYSVLEKHLGFRPIIETEKLKDLEFKGKINSIDVASKIEELDVLRSYQHLIEKLNKKKKN